MARNLKLEVMLNAVDRASAPIRGLQGSVQRATRTLREQQSTLKRLQREHKAAGKSGLVEEQARIQRQMDETSSSIERQRTHLTRLNAQQRAMNRGNAMMWKGTKQIGMAMGAGYAATRLMQPGFSFAGEMSKVQALTRLDKNDPQFKALKEQAKELGRTTWASATQAAEGQSFYAMAGFDPDAIMKAMPATLNLARAGGVDVGRAADIGSNILSAFGLDPTQMDDVADILVSVFTRTNTSLEMMGETMKYVGPIAKTLNIPLEEAAAMAGILGNIGIQGGQAGTALRAMQTRLAAPPAAAKKSLKELKVQTTDTAGNLKSMPVLLMEVMKATEKLGNAKRLAHLKNIAGEEAGAAFAGFMDANNLQELERVIEAAYDSKGESSRMAKIMADNLLGDWTGLKSAWEGIQVGLAEANSDDMRALAQNVTIITQKIADFIESNPDMVSSISRIMGGFFGVTGAIGGASVALGLFLKMFFANPITAAILLFLTLAHMVYTRWESLVWFFREGIHYLGEDISRLLDKMGAIGAAYKTFWYMITSTSIWRSTTSMIRSLASALSNLEQTWESLKKTAMGVLQPIIDLIEMLTEKITKLYEKMFGEKQKPIDMERMENDPLYNAIITDQLTPRTQPELPEIVSYKDIPMTGVNRTNNVTNNHEITINAGTNASASDIASEVETILNSSVYRNKALIGDYD